jgi:CHASE3 domain sensor protein
MNTKLSFFKKYLLPLSIVSLIGGVVFYGLYKYNIVTISNIFMQGLVVNVSPEHKIKNINMLVNLKFHV